MKRPLVIFGLSDFAETVARYFDTWSEFAVVAFTADARFVQTSAFAGRPAFPLEQLAARCVPGETFFHVAVESKWLNDARAQVIRRLTALGYSPASFLHPGSAIDPTATLGEHQCVMEGVTISRGATLGDGTILFPQTHIGHGARLGAFTYLQPAVVVNRHAEIGHHCVLGSGCCVVEGARVGDWSYLQPRMLVAESIPSGTTFHPSLRAPGYVLDRRPPIPAISEAPSPAIIKS